VHTSNRRSSRHPKRSVSPDLQRVEDEAVCVPHHCFRGLQEYGVLKSRIIVGSRQRDFNIGTALEAALGRMCCGIAVFRGQSSWRLGAPPVQSRTWVGGGTPTTEGSL